MSIEYSALIRKLAQEHFDGKISTPEYRAQRKAVIDRMDREYNGYEGDEDITQPSFFRSGRAEPLN